MKALVLAAGWGPLMARCSKPMLLVWKSPLQVHFVDWARRSGPRKIAMKLPYLPRRRV